MIRLALKALLGRLKRPTPPSPRLCPFCRKPESPEALHDCWKDWVQ